MKLPIPPPLRPVALAILAAAAGFAISAPFSSPVAKGQQPDIEPNQSPAAAPERYKIVVIDSPRVEELEKQLNAQAAAGWKLRTGMDKMFIFAR